MASRDRAVVTHKWNFARLYSFARARKYHVINPRDMPKSRWYARSRLMISVASRTDVYIYIYKYI